MRYSKIAFQSLARWGVLPAHFKILFDRLAQDGESSIEADRARLMTNCSHWVAEKAASETPSEGEASLGSKLRGRE